MPVTAPDKIAPLEAVQPLFLHPEPGPRFSVAKAAARIAEPNESESRVADQLRSFAQRGLVQVRDKRGAGRTAHNLFACADLAAAAVLRTVSGLGVADTEIHRAVSLACYTWTLGEPAVAGAAHPITAALAGCARGESWYLRLDLWANVQTGEREVIARVSNDMARFPRPKGASLDPMGTLLISILRFAPRILRNTEGMN